MAAPPRGRAAMLRVFAVLSVVAFSGCSAFYCGALSTSACGRKSQDNPDLFEQRCGLTDSTWVPNPQRYDTGTGDKAATSVRSTAYNRLQRPWLQKTYTCDDCVANGVNVDVGPDVNNLYSTTGAKPTAYPCTAMNSWITCPNIEECRQRGVADNAAARYPCMTASHKLVTGELAVTEYLSSTMRGLSSAGAEYTTYCNANGPCNSHFDATTQTNEEWELLKKWRGVSKGEYNYFGSGASNPSSSTCCPGGSTYAAGCAAGMGTDCGGGNQICVDDPKHDEAQIAPLDWQKYFACRVQDSLSATRITTEIGGPRLDDWVTWLPYTQVETDGTVSSSGGVASAFNGADRRIGHCFSSCAGCSTLEMESNNESKYDTFQTFNGCAPAAGKCGCGLGYGVINPDTCISSEDDSNAGLGCNCDKCPLGKYSSEIDFSECVPTPAGYPSDEGAKTFGYQPGSLPCAPGNVSAFNTGPCTICPPGTQSPGGADAGECSVCVAGEYNVAYGQVNCTICPAGHECPDPAAQPLQCGYGRANAEGSPTNCTSCGRFTLITEDGEDKGEVAGHSDAETEAQCKVCAMGQYAPWHADLLHPSADDKPVLEPTSCLPCPVGFECGDMGLTKPTNCSMDTYSKEGAGPCNACPTIPANWANIGDPYESRADPQSGECYTYEHCCAAEAVCQATKYANMSQCYKYNPLLPCNGHGTMTDVWNYYNSTEDSLTVCEEGNSSTYASGKTTCSYRLQDLAFTSQPENVTFIAGHVLEQGNFQGVIQGVKASSAAFVVTIKISTKTGGTHWDKFNEFVAGAIIQQRPTVDGAVTFSVGDNFSLTNTDRSFHPAIQNSTFVGQACTECDTGYKGDTCAEDKLTTSCTNKVMCEFLGCRSATYLCYDTCCPYDPQFNMTEDAANLKYGWNKDIHTFEYWTGNCYDWAEMYQCEYSVCDSGICRKDLEMFIILCSVGGLILIMVAVILIRKYLDRPSTHTVNAYDTYDHPKKLDGVTITRGGHARGAFATTEDVWCPFCAIQIKRVDTLENRSIDYYPDPNCDENEAPGAVTCPECRKMVACI